MGGYIGAKTGTLVASASDIRGDISATDTTPEITLKNTTETDADGGRSSKITFKGEQSGGEESTLAQIQASHDAAADDEKGDLIFKTNDGNDGASPTERLRIDSNGSIVTATLGTDNVHLGEGAGASIASGGNQNVAIGKNALTPNTTGDYNTALGANSLDANTTSDYNTAVGYNALTANQTGTGNVAVGVALGANTTANDNTAMGNGALATTQTGASNTAIGRNALTSGTGDGNVALGYQAGNGATTTDHSVLVGYQAGGNAALTGHDNTFVGMRAGYNTTSGGQSVAIGRDALRTNTTTSESVAVGNEAGYSSTGAKNAFFGMGAGYNISSGTNNVVIGSHNGNNQGVDMRTENRNVMISDGHGNPKQHMDYHNRNTMRSTYTTGYGIYVLNQATSGLPEGIRVGLSGTAPDTQNGHFLNVGDNSSARCVIDLNGSLRNHDNSYGGFSDLKLKENIADASSQWDDIKAVKVKKYSMKITNSDTANRIGVIAQDLEEAGMNGLVTTVTDKDPDTREDLGTETKSVKYSVLYMKALKALQEAMARIETLETKVAALEAE